MNPSSKRFFGGLESLRGIAALMVVFYHIDWPNPVTSHLFFRNGYLMVDLFFVLSGFVICYNYSQKIGEIKDVGHFMFLRFGRLYPLHLFFLLVFLGVEITKYLAELKFGFIAHQSAAFSENNASAFIANLFLVQPFLPFANKTFNSPSWSIGVEFYTYLIFAFIVLLASGKKRLSLVSSLMVLPTAGLLIFYDSDGLSAMPGWSFLGASSDFFWACCPIICTTAVTRKFPHGVEKSHWFFLGFWPFFYHSKKRRIWIIWFRRFLQF